MKDQCKEQQPLLKELISNRQQQKIASLPLEFQYFPVEILSKQFTKLNSKHPFRVYYLGPRPINTLLLHKKYSANESSNEILHSTLDNVITFPKYKCNMKKIVSSNFINEKLQNNHYYKSAIFYRAFQGMNPTLNLLNQYVFNSSFQSGNLDCVIKIHQHQFDLFLRIDSNTRGHTSWYYFSIKNMKQCERITLNICNLTKSKNLYEQGMKPYIFSKVKFEKESRFWEQGGLNCKFEEKQLRYEIVYEKVNPGATYKLSFQYEFDEEDDQVFFAYSIPYTYSQLTYDIRSLPQELVKHSVLCKSLTGLELPVLHITNHQDQIKQVTKNKRNVVITARAHPGQSNGSYLLKGFIQFLIGNTKQAIEIRSAVNFFIIPMLNPDGVIMGNTRTSAAGKDLNRQFHTIRKQLYPEVYAVKNLTAKIQKKYGVLMYLDFHGHSRKKNTFLYGPSYGLGDAEYYKCRILPRIIEKIDNNFRFYSCNFMINESKKNTARAIMLNQLKIPYPYTIESSVGLYYDCEQMKTLHFFSQVWEDMGLTIGKSVSQFITAFDQHEELMKERRILRFKQKQRREKHVTNKKSSKKFIEDQEEFIILNSNSNKKYNLFADLIEEAKAVTAQAILSKNQQAEVSSDDHDEKENLQAFKMAEFNNLIIQNIQKESRFLNKKIQDENDFLIVLPSPPIQNVHEDINQGIIVHENRNLRKKGEQTKHNSNLFDIKSASKSSYSILQENKKSLSEFRTLPSKRTINKEKNFVLSNKERYNIVTKNLFPIEDRCEILELPQNIQNIKKQLKKGRNLIKSLWQSQVKQETTNHQSPILKLQDKVKKLNFLQFKASNVNVLNRCGGVRSSSRNRMPEMQKMPKTSARIRKSISQALNIYDIPDEHYSTLEGFQIDNLAMTIRTFKPLPK